MRPYPVSFRADLPLGRCVGLALPAPDSPVVDEALAALPPEEQALAQRFAARRKATFTGGRYALREILAEAGTSPPTILWNDRGAPALPAGVRASISHKDDLAVAFLAEAGEGAAGIDLESRRARSRDVAAYVLTEAELRRLGGVPGVSSDEEVLLRFSAKEALYKVLDPYLRRFIGFHEVEIDPSPAGRCEVRLRLKEGQPPSSIELRWTTSEALGVDAAPFFLTTAVSARS